MHYSHAQMQCARFLLKHIVLWHVYQGDNPYVCCTHGFKF